MTKLIDWEDVKICALRRDKATKKLLRIEMSNRENFKKEEMIKAVNSANNNSELDYYYEISEDEFHLECGRWVHQQEQQEREDKYDDLRHKRDTIEECINQLYDIINELN